jgi:hypothetical protein
VTVAVTKLFKWWFLEERFLSQCYFDGSTINRIHFLLFMPICHKKLISKVYHRVSGMLVGASCD